MLRRHRRIEPFMARHGGMEAGPVHDGRDGLTWQRPGPYGVQ
jgi:hypothetical protein